jgi:SNF2 family DNA or RNA helicase
MQNRFDELFALLHLLAPGALGPSTKGFEAAFGRPIKLGQRRGASQADAAAGDGARRALRVRLEPVMLRRNKSVIEASMPRLVHHVVFVELADVQVGRAFQRWPLLSLLSRVSGALGIRRFDGWIIDAL